MALGRQGPSQDEVSAHWRLSQPSPVRPSLVRLSPVRPSLVRLSLTERWWLSRPWLTELRWLP